MLPWPPMSNRWGDRLLLVTVILYRNVTTLPACLQYSRNIPPSLAARASPPRPHHQLSLSRLLSFRSYIAGQTPSHPPPPTLPIPDLPCTGGPFVCYHTLTQIPEHTIAHAHIRNGKTEYRERREKRKKHELRRLKKP